LLVGCNLNNDLGNAEDNEYAQLSGERLYDSRCVSCHGDLGLGTNLGPAIDPQKPYYDGHALNTYIELNMQLGGPCKGECAVSIQNYIRTWVRADNPGSDDDPDAVTGDAVAGKTLYDQYGCAGCHGANGQGTNKIDATKSEFWSQSAPDERLSLAVFISKYMSAGGQCVGQCAANVAEYIKTWNSVSDSDLDGVNDGLDQCPNTPAGMPVDSMGCADTQKDTDEDGVNDALDTCPNTPKGVAVDAEGCPLATSVDSDGDSVTNDKDLCPETKLGDIVDLNGCSSFDRGAIEYVDQGCAGCHGSAGQGGASGGPVNAQCHKTNCQNVAQLAVYLSTDMPYLKVDECVDFGASTCATDVASFMVQAFAPQNVGDADNDGVYDEFDLCPATPEDKTASVDGTGCPVVNPIQLTIYAINAGGNAFVASDGTAYDEDSNFTGGSVFKSTAPISGTTDDVLYQTERFGNVVYKLALPPSSYQIQIHLAETYHSLADKRVFDIRIEDEVVEAGIDLASLAGKNAAVVKTYNADVIDNELFIQFKTVKDNAKVSAIKVVRNGNDGDGDGIEDSQDQCSGTMDSAKIDGFGCSNDQLDKDRDGIVEGDVCPDTEFNAAVETEGQLKGCSAAQIAMDDDDDNVPNVIDLCPATPSNAQVGDTGCSSQLNLSNERQTTPFFRVTNDEYRNTVKAAFGLDTLPSFDLPNDNSEGVFSNNAIDSLGSFDAYVIAAEAISNEVAKELFNVCDWQNNTASCISSHLATPLHLLYSGQDTIADRTTMQNVMELAFADGASQEIALRAALTRAFVDERLIFKIEVGQGYNDNFISELTPQEIASRLAFLLNDQAPDSSMLALAEQDALTDVALVSEVERLMSKPEYEDVVWSFFAQWLGIPKDAPPKGEPVKPVGDQCNATSECKATYGDAANDCKNSSSATSMCMCGTDECWSLQASESLEYSSWKESNLFVKHVIANGSWRDLFTADYSFVNGTLAEHYGISKPATDWQRVDMPASAKRQGVLTQASFLTLNGKEESDVSWIFRGKAVYEHLFCQHLPLPPPSSADQVVVSREETAPCSGCHKVVDPVGRIFDAYDEHGKLRTDSYLTNGRLGFGTDIDGNYADAVAFSTALGDSESLGQCLTQMWYRFALGRHAFEQDTVSFNTSYDALNSQNKFEDLIKSFVLTESFKTIVSEEELLQCAP
jgi:mono/diheme cytochrome c family protein